VDADAAVARISIPPPSWPLPTDAALIKLLGSPDLGSKRWITEQYDTLILGNTIQGPGGDAAVVRLGDGPKGLALTTDCTERYCEADPREGGKQAVAEAWRNLIAVGARPLALTDNLNFGNPEKRAQTMGELVGCIEGIGEAARALDFPVVSGNVSLYNETMGAGFRRRPRSAASASLDDVAKSATLAFKAAGEDILLIGGAPSWLGRSAWLMTVAGREEGAPPPVDLAAERRNGAFVASLIRAGQVSAVHDLSDGGLAVALAEMALAGGIGATIAADASEHAFFFGEDQGRYVLTSAPAETAAIAEEAKRLAVPLSRIGVTGGETLRLGGAAPVALAALTEAYESWLPDFMDRS
jgi:phosphoribosylformylglycinamidine (FGAM) synthase-like enzyme